jgi:hypothetical protein
MFLAQYWVKCQLNIDVFKTFHTADYLPVAFLHRAGADEHFCYRAQWQAAALAVCGSTMFDWGVLTGVTSRSGKSYGSKQVIFLLSTAVFYLAVLYFYVFVHSCERPS